MQRDARWRGSHARQPRIVVAYENLGPYHVARLRAVAQRCELLALEFAPTSTTYDWARSASVPFTRVTLGPARTADQALRAFDPDVVFVPGWYSRDALLLLSWCLRHGKPAILMSDSQEIDEPRARGREFVKSRIVGLFSGALVAGRRHAEYLRKLGFHDRPVRDKYDVVDNDHFRASERAPRLGDLRSDILCCARLVPKKNLGVLVAAFHAVCVALRTRGSPLPRLVVLGEGPLRPELARQVESLGLQEHVRMPGFVPYAELPPHYHRAALFVLASTTEQWGLVVNEAMAAGCPVLVSERAGCAPELVAEGENGHTIDPGDVDALARRMLELLADPDRRAAFGRASLRRIAGFTVQAHADAVLDLAKQAIKPVSGMPSYWYRRAAAGALGLLAARQA